MLFPIIYMKRDKLGINKISFKQKIHKVNAKSKKIR